MFRRILAALAMVAIMTGVSLADKTTESNTASCKRFYAEVNKGNLGIIDELVADDFVEHETGPGFSPDKEGLKKWFAMMRTAFPDLMFNVDFYMADGDKVASYVSINGTQQGEFMGMPATGKKISVRTIDIVRIKNGKAVEHWGVTDAASMMAQLKPE
jgi:steroid delta-isomerase-like uncharacterized protein